MPAPLAVSPTAAIKNGSRKSRKFGGPILHIGRVLLLVERDWVSTKRSQLNLPLAASSLRNTLTWL